MPTPRAAISTVCRRAAADGVVMLKNDGVLPFSGEKIAVYGRTAYDYLASGTGSGGCVHPDHIISIAEGIARSRGVALVPSLHRAHKRWIARHPFDRGNGWATEPWHQAEFVPDADVIASAASLTDCALVVIGRWAGEDKDNAPEAGSWYLTDEERELLRRVTAAHSRVAVAINSGNIIDMSWVEEFGVGAVLYVWQGGQEGGAAVADIISGRVSPSGKLPDTIARSIEDYPSHKNFGSPDYNIYEEDVYVGYRWFETFAPERVMYPFGFGLSYTTFDVKITDAHAANGKIIVSASVTNTGNMSGREVVEVYFCKRGGVIRTPEAALCAYKKTRTLAPSQSQTLRISFPVRELASYDDSGATGHKSCWVLEPCGYAIFAGTDVKSALGAGPVFTYHAPRLAVVERCTEALAPVREFYRVVPHQGDGVEVAYERAPTRTYDIVDRIEASRPDGDKGCTGDRGIKLADVKSGAHTMEEFVLQMNADELCAVVRAEGIASKKVKMYTTAAFGGVTDTLAKYGVPVVTNVDGPSGVRSDYGEPATLLPNGTLLASTFDDDLVEELYALEGKELVEHGVDALLGPGVNIHRHPCCGRNFEYFSEDPLLTGKIAAAVCRGVAAFGGNATLKHFAANDQEFRRNDCDSVMSERCAREIHLRPFEIAVKEGGAVSIMTSYNLLNGCHCASNYDLTTTILRGEWGFKGFVMTDWWAKANRVGMKGDKHNLAEMIRAQNDIYMVTPDADGDDDNIRDSLESGRLTFCELRRCAMNVLYYIINTPSFARQIPPSDGKGE